MIQKINFYPIPEDYYSTQSLKPGFFFFKELASNRYISHENLEVNIPETIICIDSTLIYLYTDENGKIATKYDIPYGIFESKVNSEFDNFCGKNHKYRLKNSKEITIQPDNYKDLPFVISRSPGSSDYQFITVFFYYNLLSIKFYFLY